MTTDLNEDPGQAVDQQQQPASSELNGQEPMRRRRRPGRKRKRRPQQQQRADGEPTPLPGSELSSSWRGQVDDDPDSLQERDGIILFNNKSEPSSTSKPVDERIRSEVPRPQRNQNKNEFVQGIVLRVQDNTDGEEEAQQSRQVEDIRMPTERRAAAEDNRSYRRPYSVAKKEEEEQTEKHGTPGAAALKNLLKQNGGLSLSEILQQQNLSLDDLLKGKQTALKALQNTSAPIEPAVETQKGPRRIPGPGRPVNAVTLEGNAPKPLRRNNFNQQATTTSEEIKPIRRIPNYQKVPKPTVELILAPPSPTDINAEEVSMVGTIASFMVPPKPSEPIIIVEPTINAYADVVTISTRAENSPGLRRLPIAPGERIKPIKEVVSGIRPDLHNSSIRKRIQPVKVGGNLTNIIAVSTTTRPKFGIDLRERLPPRWGNGYRLKSTPTSITNEINEKQEIASEVVLNVDGAVVAPAELTTSTTTTTTAATTTVRTPDIIKDIVKSRLLLRPRIKGVYTTSATTTKTTSTEQPSTELPTETSVNFEFSETYETTIIPYMEDVDILFSNSSQDDIGEIISKSEPGIDVIEQLPAFEEFAIKAEAEVESINQLFQNAFNEDDSLTLRNDGFDNVNAVENIIQRSQIKDSSEHVGSISIDRDVTEENPSLFVDITSTRPVDDRTDILELLEDRRSGARLYKVLAQRNMTLNELLDHRQRGSSQLHLAEIFHNKSKTDVPAPAPADHLDIVTAFDNFPTFNLGNVKSVKPDDIKTDSEGSSYFTSIINIKPTDEVFKEGRALREEKVKVPAIAATKQAQTERSTDFWNFDEEENNVIDDGEGATQKPIVSSSRLSPLADEVGGDSVDAVYKGVEQIENEVARAHDIIDLELSGHGYKRSSVIVESAHNMPVGVRSAIIASSSIVGISFLVFIIIFVTCRWRQRRKKTFNYSENFQAVRSRLPILTRESGSSSKRSTSPPDVFPGSSRSSKINTMDPNSPEVQEYLYDAMRKPFQ